MGIDYFGASDAATDAIEVHLADQGLELSEAEYDKLNLDIQYLVKQIIATKA